MRRFLVFFSILFSLSAVAEEPKQAAFDVGSKTASLSDLNSSTTMTTVEKGAFGVGAIIGKPTGITAKYFFNDTHAIQGQVGASMVGDGYVGSLDYLVQPLIISNNEIYVMPVYIGAGVQLRSLSVPNESLRSGPRAVIGTSFDFKALPIDVFFEGAVAGEFLLSGTDRSFRLPVSIAFGVHYYM